MVTSKELKKLSPKMEAAKRSYDELFAYAEKKLDELILAENAKGNEEAEISYKELFGGDAEKDLWFDVMCDLEVAYGNGGVGVFDDEDDANPCSKPYMAYICWGDTFENMDLDY